MPKLEKAILLLHGMGEAHVSDSGEVELDFNSLSHAALVALELFLAGDGAGAGIAAAAHGENEQGGPPLGAPPNHSSMPRSVSNAAPAAVAEYPLYAHATELVLELRAGQMLYMPCGWWHEVRSEGNEEDGNDGLAAAVGEERVAGAAQAQAQPQMPMQTQTQPQTQPQAQQDGGHVSNMHAAINYWFHPPDTTSYTKPYTTAFFETAFLAASQEMGI